MLQDAFVSDPGAIVKNGQLVNVRISSWDPAANRLSLTMKNATDSGMNGDSNSAGPSDDGQARRNPRQGKVATAGISLQWHQLPRMRHVSHLPPHPLFEDQRWHDMLISSTAQST